MRGWWKRRMLLPLKVMSAVTELRRMIVSEIVLGKRSKNGELWRDSGMA